jgi:prevent-host-death family protein
MATVTTRVLKDRLSEWLLRAEAGERVVVLRHGKPIATLCPIDPAEPSADPDVALAFLAQGGLIELPDRPGLLPGRRPTARAEGALASDMVLEDRR